MPAIKVIKKKTTQNKETDRKPLLSHSTVLILSGFLIGMVCRRIADPRIEVLVFAVGVLGVVAYIGLDQVARRRQERAHRTAAERANQDLERRIDRHIARESTVQSGRRRDASRRARRVVNSPLFR